MISKVKFGSKHIQALLGAGGYGSWKSLGVSDVVAGSLVTERESGIRERQREVEQRDRDFKHSEEAGTTEQLLSSYVSCVSEAPDEGSSPADSASTEPR